MLCSGLRCRFIIIIEAVRQDNKIIYNNSMANFYTESDEPLKTVLSNPFSPFMTSPRTQPRISARPSPLSVITKFLLGELEKPTHATHVTARRIKECKVTLEKQEYVRRELIRSFHKEGQQRSA